MDVALTETCPTCSGSGGFWNGRDVETEEDCASCFGKGRVEAGLVWCPACSDGGEGCEHCRGRMLVKAEDVPAIERAMEAEAAELAFLKAEQAEIDAMAARGLHESGVPFRGPF